MISLKAANETLEILTSSTAGIDYSITWVDVTTTTYSPSTSEGKITTATTTSVVSAPAASTQRQIKIISIRNIHASTSNAITVKKDIATTEYFLTPTITLLAGEVLLYIDSAGWILYNADGTVKQQILTTAILTGLSITTSQVIAATDTVLLALGFLQAQVTKQKEIIQLAVSDETTALTTGTGKVTFRLGFAFTLTEVRASLTTAQATGSIFTVDINEAGTTILSTKLTIDNTEKTSTTAATPPVISDSSLADDAEITIDIDQVGDGTAKGLKVILIGTRT